MTNIYIDIAAEFTGKKAFKQTESAVDKLGKKLKHALIGAGVTSILTSATKAFIEDEKAASILANTLQNLGFAKLTGDIEKFIGMTQLATGVSDNQLRPAFQGLVTATHNVSKSQELLKLALDISAGSGVNLETVTTDLAKAFAGNTKGLQKYKLGLSTVELKTMSFMDIQTRLNSTFTGASAKAADTYAGKLQRLGQAVGEAKEALGKGIIDGLMTATGSANIDILQQKIIDFGTSAGNTFRELGKILKNNLTLIATIGVSLAAIWTINKIAAGITATILLIKKVNSAFKILRATAIGTAIAEMAVLNPLGAVAYGLALVGVIAGTIKAVDLLGDSYEKAANKKDALLTGRASAHRSFTGGSGASMSTGGRNLADEAVARKNAADLLKSNKAATAAQIAAAKIAKAAAIFDMKKIQIVAALKGNISEEERIRLELMLAIENKQVDKVTELEKKLKDVQDRNAILLATLASIPSVGNPFAEAQNGINALIDSTRVFTLEEVAAASTLADSYVVAMANVNDFATMASNAAAALTTKAESDAAAAANALAAALAAADRFAALMKPEYYNGSSANDRGGNGQYYNGSSANIIPGAGGGGSTINITVNGAIDPIGTANAISNVIKDNVGNTGSLGAIGTYGQSRRLND